jgi:hypothetical protein
MDINGPKSHYISCLPHIWLCSRVFIRIDDRMQYDTRCLRFPAYNDSLSPNLSCPILSWRHLASRYFNGVSLPRLSRLFLVRRLRSPSPVLFPTGYEPSSVCNASRVKLGHIHCPETCRQETGSNSRRKLSQVFFQLSWVERTHDADA